MLIFYATNLFIVKRTRVVADTVLTCDENFSVFSPGVVDFDDDCITWVGSLEEKTAEPER